MPALDSTLLALALVAAAGPGPPGSATNEAPMNLLLIDDFSRPDGLSALGTEWRVFTDRVMGGASRGQAERDSLGDAPCLHLHGVVSLENDGGFIQAALPLEASGGSFDAADYRGLRVTVAGDGGTYFLHLRTADTRLPWQYYRTSFAAGDAWREIDLPFSAFRSENLRAPLDPGRLQRVALVAARRAGPADVSLARIAFYR